MKETKKTTGGNVSACGKKQKRAKAAGFWRKSMSGGCPVVVDPAGRVYHGTSKEIQKANIAPCWRDRLARSIRAIRSIIADERMKKNMIADERMDTIFFCGADRTGENIRLLLDMLVGVIARERHESFEESKIRCLMADVESLATEYGDIPLTFHERRFLSRFVDGTENCDWKLCERLESHLVEMSEEA